MVHAVEDDAHTLPSRDEGSNPNSEADGGEDSPATPGVAQDDENGSEDATKDPCSSQTTGKDNSGAVTVANCPSDEVLVGLVTQRPFYCVDDSSKGRRMRRGSQGMQKTSTLFGGQVQLTWSTFCDVD